MALVLVGLVIASGGIAVLLNSRSGPAIEIRLPSPTPAEPWRVYLSGAVATPGIRELPGDVTLERALEAAGGTAPGADNSRLQLHVPSLEPEAEGRSGGEKLEEAPLPTFPPEPAKVNINTASAEEIQAALKGKGIGPVLAGRIVEHRREHPFQRIEDIVDVQGIGPAIFDKIKDLITVGA